MSTAKKQKFDARELKKSIDESNQKVVNLNTNIDSSLNILNTYYTKDDTNKFMKQIDKLNISFLILSDKYLKQQNEINKVKDNLFMNLFKQISIYVEEIERLNLKIKEREGSAKAFRENNLREITKENTLSKNLIKQLEDRVKEKTQTEEKLRKEIASYKRQISFYKDQLRIELDMVKESKKPSSSKPKASSKSKTVVGSNKRNLNLSQCGYTSSYDKKKSTNTSKSILIRQTSPIKTQLKGTLSNRSEKNKVSLKKSKHSHNRSVEMSSQKLERKSIFGIISETPLAHFKDKKDEVKNLSFLEQQEIMEEIADDIRVDFDNELRMLTDQENEIAKMIKIINYKKKDSS